MCCSNLGVGDAFTLLLSGDVLRDVQLDKVCNQAPLFIQTAADAVGVLSSMDRAAQLHQQIEYYQQHQQQLLADIQNGLYTASHGHSNGSASDTSLEGIKAQIQTLGLLSHTRSYVERLKGTAEQVKQLERQIRPASHMQDVVQLVDLATAAADRYAACMTDVEQLASCSYPTEAVPQQLRSMEDQLRQRLEAVQSSLRQVLSQQIHNCLAQCGWPPPITPSQGGEQLFSTAHAEAINALQLLMKALTQLQSAAQHEEITAALEYESNSGGSTSSIAGPEPPLLWIAVELVAPLARKLQETFGSSAQGSAGDIQKPDLMLAVVHRLAQDRAPSIDFLQGILQGLELHSIYQLTVEFTRALRDAVKQLLRQYKFPEVAAAGQPELWLKWVDALIDFEGVLGRSSLLGIRWDSNTSQGELPFVLLRGSTLTVLGENPAWMDAWLEAESAWALRKVESVLYSPEGWERGQLLIAEDGPACQADFWPPRAAEEVVNLVEGMLQTRLRFIPDPQAQERYLQGAVAEVLSQAHGRITRILQQADLFKNITGRDWLYKVCPCICFCAYVEEQLQVMHDNAEVITARIVQEQKAQEQEGQHSGHQQQQDHPVANGNHSHDSQQQWTQQQQQQQPRASANGLTHRQRMSDSAALAAVVAAASTKLRVLARPINEFSSCRREWVLKLGKAIAMAFMQKAAGYVSRGAMFKATSDDVLELQSAGVVSGDLQVALAWLKELLETLSQHLDKQCFRQAWGAAAAAINRELFNNVACEAYFSDAGAWQLAVDLQALESVFLAYTSRPRSYFRELADAVKLLVLDPSQAETVRQAVNPSSRSKNAVDVLRSVQVHHLDADLADTVLSLRMYQPQ